MKEKTIPCSPALTCSLSKTCLNFQGFSHKRKGGCFPLGNATQTPSVCSRSYTSMPSAFVGDNGKRKLGGKRPTEANNPITVGQLQPYCNSHNIWARERVGNVNRTLIAVMSLKRHLVITLSKRKLSILARLYKQRRHFESTQETGSAVLKVSKSETHLQLLAKVSSSANAGKYHATIFQFQALNLKSNPNISTLCDILAFYESLDNVMFSFLFETGRFKLWEK